MVGTISMSVVNLLDIIWLHELNMAIIYPDQELGEAYAAAAIVIKGEDGTDQFIPYEGFLARAPIAFHLGQSHHGNGFVIITVLGFADSGVPVELAVFQLDEELVPHTGTGDLLSDANQALHLVGFGERRSPVGSLSLKSGVQENDDNGFSEQSEIGLCALDYEVEGAVDYGGLLAAYLADTRASEYERFTGFYITAVRRSGDRIGPAVQLKPLHHYQFGLGLRSLLLPAPVDKETYADDRYADDIPSPLEGAAILSRYSKKGRDESAGYGEIEVPEVTLFAGSSRESVDFILRSGFKVHWRRQLENWNQSEMASVYRGGQGLPVSFEMEALSEREDLEQREGDYYFRWLFEGAVIGDVVGVVFAGARSGVELEIALEDQECAPLKGEGLFIFMGDGFVPLDEGMRNYPENLGLVARLGNHVEKGLKQAMSQNFLNNERVELAKGLFDRDHALQKILHGDVLAELAASAPIGPELMVYRDYILQMAEQPDLSVWLEELFGPVHSASRDRFVDTLRFDLFKKCPTLAHVLVFNKSFREKYYNRPLNPQSSQKSLLDIVLSTQFSENLIGWAENLKGESQAILWHLALKRPHMVERLYEMKLEPDAALNPFDDKSLDHAETALSESSHIDVEVLERKVIPVLKSRGDTSLIEAVDDFVIGLSYGGENRKLNIGALSVCLGAVEKAEGIWQGWVSEASEIFQPLIEPLSLALPDFNSDVDFTGGLQVNELRRDIEHLSQRLVEEKELDGEIVQRIGRFTETLETDVFLKEIRRVLDLGLKYHHDLSIGVKSIYRHFETDEAIIDRINAVRSEEWPSLEHFGPTFAKPFQRRQVESEDEFDSQVYDFAQSVHPGDVLFLNTLKNSLLPLEQALAKLVWLAASGELQQRLTRTQHLLRDQLLEMGPLSAKLRRSKTLSKAIKHMIVAERMGPQGWPILYKNLEVIEKNLDISQ